MIDYEREFIPYVPPEPPAVIPNPTVGDNGKFLGVTDGEYSIESLPEQKPLYYDFIGKLIQNNTYNFKLEKLDGTQLKYSELKTIYNNGYLPRFKFDLDGKTSSETINDCEGHTFTCISVDLSTSNPQFYFVGASFSTNIGAKIPSAGFASFYDYQ